MLMKKNAKQHINTMGHNDIFVACGGPFLINGIRRLEIKDLTTTFQSLIVKSLYFLITTMIIILCVLNLENSLFISLSSNALTLEGLSCKLITKFGIHFFFPQCLSFFLA